MTTPMMKKRMVVRWTEMYVSCFIPGHSRKGYIPLAAFLSAIVSLLWQLSPTLFVQDTSSALALANFVNAREATLSAAAARFLQKRRSEWAERVRARSNIPAHAWHANPGI